MCKCKDVEMGSYDNQVMLKSPSWSSKEHICVDACLEEEIKDLWHAGIVTNGCCCGHNVAHPYIGVDDASVLFMEGFGYRHVVDPANPSAEKNHFYPFNAGYTPNEAWAIAAQHDHDYYLKKGQFSRGEEHSYFLSYNLYGPGKSTSGMCELKRFGEITSYEDIKVIREDLLDTYKDKGFDNVIILNYQEMKG